MNTATAVTTSQQIRQTPTQRLSGTYGGIRGKYRLLEESTSAEGLQNACTVIMLQPYVLAAHIDKSRLTGGRGIAYGMGKRCIMVSEAPKPETLYFLFTERYESMKHLCNSCLIV